MGEYRAEVRMKSPLEYITPAVVRKYAQHTAQHTLKRCFFDKVMA